MTGKIKKHLCAVFILLIVFSCLASLPALHSGAGVSASFSVEDGMSDEDGSYIIPGFKGFSVPYKLLFDGSPDFNFRRGFCLEWISGANDTAGGGALDGVIYEISFLTSGTPKNAGIVIGQNGPALSVTRFSAGMVSEEKTGIGAALLSHRVKVCFEARDEVFVFAVNGETAVEWPMDRFAADEEAGAQLVFTNKSQKLYDAAKIVSLSPGNWKPEEPEEPGDPPEIPEEPEEPGDPPEVPEEPEEPGDPPEIPVEPDEPEKSKEQEEPENPEEPVSPLRFEYEAGSGDFAILLEPLGLAGITEIRCMDKKLLIPAQAEISDSAITLQEEYLEALYGNIEDGAEPRFTIRGKNALGEEITVKITLAIVEKAPEEPENPPEDPDDPLPEDPDNPPEDPDNPPEEPENPPEDPGDPPEDPDTPPEEPGGPAETPREPFEGTGEDINQNKGGGQSVPPKSGNKGSIGSGSGGDGSPDISQAAGFALFGGGLLAVSLTFFIIAFGGKGKMKN